MYENGSDLLSSYNRFSSWLEAMTPAYYSKSRTEMLSRFIKDRNPKAHVIWDCACGVGSCAIDLASAWEKVIASDISEEMLGYAIRRAKERGVKNVAFYRSDWRNLVKACSGEKADVAINMGVNLYHLKKEEMTEAIVALRGILTPGGLLIIDNKRWRQVLIDDIFIYKERMIEDRPVIRSFSPAPLADGLGREHFYLDVAHYEEDAQILTQVRIESEILEECIRGNTQSYFVAGGTRIMIEKEGDAIKYKAFGNEATAEAMNLIRAECINIVGYPISSEEIASKLQQAGFINVQIMDREPDLFLRPERKGLYDLIVATL